MILNICLKIKYLPPQECVIGIDHFNSKNLIFKKRKRRSTTLDSSKI